MCRVETAAELFSNSTNCAQAVLLAFAEENGISDVVAMRLGAGFGAGMGRLQKTCGAVTGAVMVIGLEHTKKKDEPQIIKEKIIDSVQKFDKEFIELYGTTSCRDLLNCDLKTEEGQKTFKSGLKSTICLECVKDSVKILEKMFY